jgi:hypothetical protein
VHHAGWRPLISGGFLAGQPAGCGTRLR